MLFELNNMLFYCYCIVILMLFQCAPIVISVRHVAASCMWHVERCELQLSLDCGFCINICMQSCRHISTDCDIVHVYVERWYCSMSRD